MKLFRIIVSSILSLSLLWAGAGFSVSRHYCLGMLKSESFYTQADFCTSHSKPDSQQERCDSDCCDEEWLSIDAIEIERSVQDDTDISIPNLVLFKADLNGLVKFLNKTESPPTYLTNLLLTRPDLAQLQRYLI